MLTSRTAARPARPELRDFSGPLRHLAAVSHDEPSEQALMDRFAGVLAESLDVDCVEILECRGDRETLTLRAGIGLGGDSVGRTETAGDFGSQAGYTVLKRAPEVLTDVREGSRSYEISGLLARSGVRSGVTVPIPGAVPPGAPLGVLGVYSRRRRDYADEEVGFLAEAARYLAGGMRRHREVARRRRAQRWLGVMEEAAIRGVSATNRSGTLGSFARFLSCARVGVADLCFIDLERAGDEGIAREAAARGGAPLSAASGTEPLLYPPDPGCPHGTLAVLDSGQPHTITAVEREHLESLARDEAHLRAFLDLGATSYMCLPIKLHRRTLGALVLISCGEAYTREDERHAGRLAFLIGMTVEGIQARSERYAVTQDKSEGGLPAPPPETAGVAESVPREPSASPAPGGFGSGQARRLPKVTLHGQRRVVLNLLAQGKPPKQIAAELTISPSTVYNTESKLREIFGASDRASLLREAYRQGFIDEP